MWTRPCSVCGTPRHVGPGSAAEIICQPCRRARRGMAPPVTPRGAAVCGTESGYNAHRRKGEAPCADCRQANTLASRLRRPPRSELDPARLEQERARQRARSAERYERLRKAKGLDKCRTCGTSGARHGYCAEHAMQASRPAPFAPTERACTRCDRTFVALTRHRLRCYDPRCSSKSWNGNRPKRTNDERGYGQQHRKRRQMLLPLFIGTPCALCGDVMLEEQALDADHSVPLSVDPKSLADRVVHSSCNRRRHRVARRDPAQIIDRYLSAFESIDAQAVEILNTTRQIA